LLATIEDSERLEIVGTGGETLSVTAFDDRSFTLTDNV
jgi:hypothetical protein